MNKEQSKMLNEIENLPKWKPHIQLSERNIEVSYLEQQIQDLKQTVLNLKCELDDLLNEVNCYYD